MKKIIAAILLIGLPAGAVHAADALDARLTSVTGSVTVFYHDQGEEGVPAEEGMPLDAGDKIETGADGRAELGLDGNSVVELGASTQFTISSLERKAAAFDLGLGTLLAKIKSGLFGEGGTLEVRTPTAVAAVRGTEFGVENAGDEGSHVAVFDEGQVAVRSAGPQGDMTLARAGRRQDAAGASAASGFGQSAAGAEVLLSNNQETSVGRGQAPLRARPLARFLAHQRRMGFMRTRAAALRRRWQKLPPAKRAELRKKIFQRRMELLRQRRLQRPKPKSKREIMRERMKRRREPREQP